MGWNPFRKDNKHFGAAAAPGRSAPPLSQESARATVSQGRLDELTVLAAIENAKQQLTARDQAIASSMRRSSATTEPAVQPLAGATHDPVARKKHLIQAAMTVHRLKQSALDDLSRKERDRLRGMAETALGLSARKPPR